MEVRFRLTTALMLAAGATSAFLATALPANAASIAQTNDIVGTNFNADGRSDVALTGVSGWSTLPVASSNGNGTFSVTNAPVGAFATWASTAGAKVLTGDFNGDGRSDVALTGVSGWTTMPVAFSTGSGFTVKNFGVGPFAGWASTAGVKVLTGDFNADGRTDVALTGVSGWTTMPVAFSNGNGTFSVTNVGVGAFATWSSTAGAKALTGDFNADGRTDVALTGVSGWASVPVAYSNGNGSFTVKNHGVGAFATWAATSGAKVLTGDFNADGRTDLALTGVSAWASVPVAFSNGNGFGVTNFGVGSFAVWASTSGVSVLTGDFNADGRTDVALTGVSGWATLPVAFSVGNGSFTVKNSGVGAFATWAATSGAKVLTGDFNRDGRSDVALTGVSGWTTLPVAFSTAAGYTVTNAPVGAFATWASTSGATVVRTPDTSPR